MELATADVLSKSDLLISLKAQAGALGLRMRDSGDGFAGDMETIGAKWLLGGRKVSYRMSLRLVDAEHAVYFRDMVAEKSWGLPPPTFKVETESITGWKRAGTRTDRSIGGGGSLDYARVRETIERAVTDAGWRFQLEGGRVP
jgi:hypothetical protein